jgi:hypothetical protein
VRDLIPRADGNLYAVVFADDGGGRRELFTTDYDDELVGTYTSYHEFYWQHSVPPSTLLNPGEHVVAEIMLHATGGSCTINYNNAGQDIPVQGVVNNDYTFTFASDDNYETIDEIIGLDTILIGTSFDKPGDHPPPGWDIFDYWAGPGTNFKTVPWAPTNDSQYGITGDGDVGYVTNSINAGNGPMDAWLKSPAFDSSSFDTVRLEFAHNYNWGSDTPPEGIYVYVASDGSADIGDTQVYYDVGPPDASGIISLDITAACANSPDVQVGWYYNASYDGWWAVDDIFVNGTQDISNLEHKWSMNLPTYEAPYMFSIEAYRNDDTDGDDFVFAYSTDDIHYYDMVIVDTSTDSTLTYLLPPDISGTVYVRAQDTDRTHYNTDISSVAVDQMFISSVTDSVLTIGYDHNSTPSYVEPVISPIPTYSYNIPVDLGWNFISFPIEINGDVTTILDDTLNGDGQTLWNCVQWYDANDPMNHWKTYAVFRPVALNDLPNLNNTMGLWIYVTGNGGDGMLTTGLMGTEPSNSNILLKAGWNMAGYPAVDDSIYDVDDLKSDTVAVTVEGFNSGAPYDIQILAGNYVLKRGEAYWVYTDSDVTWTVNW